MKGAYLLTFLLVASFLLANEMPKSIEAPLGLPKVPWPEDNPYTQEKAELGRLLYFDKRLSADGTVSCATCHNTPCGYGDCRTLAIGIDGRKGTRHSPTIINSAYLKHLFWDGRVNSLEEQCKGPVANPNEMSDVADVHEAHQQCAERVAAIPGYCVLFKKVFGKDTITMEDIAKAIATFERSILSGNSPFDRYMAGDKTAMSEEQIQGFTIFKKVGCLNCHRGYNFADDRFTNIGIGMDAANPDLGRYMVTKEERDWGAFKIPTIRDAEKNSPYMHDGSLKTLEDVVDYYDKGGIPNKNLHPLIKPLHLSTEDKQALVSFMKALNGEGWQHFQPPTQFP